jgi:hypothetical protein
MALSNKQQVFVSEYLTCWNASEAARRAGYNGKSNVIGSQLLANLSISDEIKRRVDEITMSANEALVRLTDEARSSVAYFLKPDSLEIDPLKVHELGHLIKSLSWTANGPKIELYDAQAALVHIGRAHKIFDSGPITIDLPPDSNFERALVSAYGLQKNDSTDAP